MFVDFDDFNLVDVCGVGGVGDLTGLFDVLGELGSLMATSRLKRLTRSIIGPAAAGGADHHALLHLRRRMCELEARERRAARVARGEHVGAFAPTCNGQFGEDVALWELFAGQETGFFIEAGAFDGVTLSVSYLFESVGWRGLLVEPIAEQYAKAVAARAGSRVVNGALSHHGAPKTLKFAHMAAAGLHSTLDVASVDTLSDRRRDRYQPSVVEVPVFTMDALLAEHRGPIDAVVLDVEGGEFDLLRGFDLARHKPRALLIEDNTHRRDKQVPGLLEAAGYRRAARVHINDLYVRTDDAALNAKLAAMPAGWPWMPDEE